MARKVRVYPIDGKIYNFRAEVAGIFLRKVLAISASDASVSEKKEFRFNERREPVNLLSIKVHEFRPTENMLTEPHLSPNFHARIDRKKLIERMPDQSVRDCVGLAVCSIYGGSIVDLLRSAKQ